MHPILNKNLFFVKEQVGILKASNSFDIFDGESQQLVMLCREENLGFLTKLLRFTDFKTATPFEIDIKTPSGEKILTVRRGVSIFLSKVEVLDGKGNLIGVFKQKLVLLKKKFEVLDASERSLCLLMGNWTSWEFNFMSTDKKIFATVSKRWSGFGKEFFTSADNYVLQISNEVPADHSLRMLILAAVMCIDLVLKE